MEPAFAEPLFQSDVRGEVVVDLVLVVGPTAGPVPDLVGDATDDGDRD